MTSLRLASPAVVLGAFLATPLFAQRVARPGESASMNVAYDPRLYTSPTSTSPRFKALRWRLVGPFRGGRVDAVAGDPTRPLVFYFGAVNGGVWKVQYGDYAPTKQHLEMFAEWSDKVATQLRLLQQLEQNELAALNRLLKELGMPEVFVPRPKVIS